MAWRWQSGVQSLAPLDRTAACVSSPLWRIDSKCWGGLCGSNPSWHSRSAYRRALAVQPFGYLQSRTCRPQGNRFAEFLVGRTDMATSVMAARCLMPDLIRGAPFWRLLSPGRKAPSPNNYQCELPSPQNKRFRPLSKRCQSDEVSAAGTETIQSSSDSSGPDSSSLRSLWRSLKLPARDGFCFVWLAAPSALVLPHGSFSTNGWTAKFLVVREMA